LKDSRVGESLWEEWSGDGHSFSSPLELSFYTIDHVFAENELVRRALASCLQRDGVADSLGEAFKYLEFSQWVHLHAGYVDSDNELTICDEDGFTEYGDLVDDILQITLVEI
jgi:hypothetical protein